MNTKVKETSPHHSPHVVPIHSETVAKAILAEIMFHPSLLCDSVKKALSADGNPRAIATALERMKIWADLSTLLASSLNTEEAQRREAALTYCVVRNANYELLRRLFTASRAEVIKLRKLNKVKKATRPKKIPGAQLTKIFDVWKDIEQNHTSEVDRWLHLAQHFSEYGLNSLYSVIVKDGSLITSKVRP